MTIERTRLSPYLGLAITGMTGADLLEPGAADDCLADLDRHGVVVYRELDITTAELVAFSRLLGEVVVPSVNDPGEHPEVATITMDPERSRLAAVRKGNFLWHIDGAHDVLPQRATLLCAREIDPAGGDTEFATTYAAYDALPDERKREIDDLRVVHRFSRPMRISFPNASDDARAGWDRVPERTHPLVWRRAGGRRSLLIGSTADEIVGWSEERSRALLDELDEWSTRPEFTYRHQWRVGDLVVWDNTGMLHRALPFEPSSRRLLERTTLVGVEATGA